MSRIRATHRLPNVTVMAVVVALDAGTTGVRAFAVDEAGQPAGYRYREFTQHFPRPGWVEHDATEIWEAVVATTTELIASLDQPVAALGITNQRETVVVWDRRSGKPLHRALVWQDRRTAERCEALEAAGHLPLVRDRPGWCSIRTSRRRSSSGCCTEGGVDAGPNWRSARSTRGWSGS